MIRGFALLCLALLCAMALTACRAEMRVAPTDVPCLEALKRFTGADALQLASSESESPMGKWTNGITRDNLPGKGLGEHSMLYIGESYTKMFVVNSGKVIWTYQTGKGYEYDDAWMLSNGNILFTRMQYVAEITPENRHGEIDWGKPVGNEVW